MQIARFNTRRSTLTLTVLGAAFAGSVVLAPASYAATGSYGNAGVVPADVTNVRTVRTSSTFTIPTTVSSAATVTTVSASYSYQSKPASYVLSVWLCYNSANQICVQVPSTSGTYGSTGSLNASSAFAGRSAKGAQWHWWTYVDDGSTSTIHAAINPSMWAPNNYSNSADIYYNF